MTNAFGGATLSRWVMLVAILVGTCGLVASGNTKKVFIPASLAFRLRRFNQIRLAVTFKPRTTQIELHSHCAISRELGDSFVKGTKHVYRQARIFNALVELVTKMKRNLPPHMGFLVWGLDRMEYALEKPEAPETVTKLYEAVNYVLDGTHQNLGYTFGDLTWVTQHVSTLMALNMVVTYLHEYFAKDAVGWPELDLLYRNHLPHHTFVALNKVGKLGEAFKTHACMVKLMPLLVRHFKAYSDNRVKFNLSACLAKKPPKRVDFDKFVNSTALEEAVKVPGSTVLNDRGHRWDDISVAVPPPYSLLVHTAAPAVRAVFHGSVQLPLAAEASRVCDRVPILKSLKMFADCARGGQSGCVWDERMRVYRPTKPGFFSTGEGKEQACPEVAGVVYNRGGLEKEADCLLKAAACVGEDKFMQEGECKTVPLGYISAQCSDDLKECANKDWVEKDMNKFARATFWEGSCTMKLVEGGLILPVNSRISKVFEKRVFTMDFDVALIEESWDTLRVSSTRVLGVRDNWSIELAKTSTEGEVYPIFRRGSVDRYTGSVVKLVKDAGNKWKGCFKLVSTTHFMYLIYQNKEVLLRAGYPGNFSWLDNKNAIALGPEEAYIQRSSQTWDFEVGIAGVVDVSTFDTSRFDAVTSVLTRKLNYEDFFESAGDHIVSFRGLGQAVVISGKPKITVKEPQGGWPGLGTEADDWPRSTDPKNFFYGSTDVNLTALEQELTREDYPEELGIGEEDSDVEDGTEVEEDSASAPVGVAYADADDLDAISEHDLYEDFGDLDDFPVEREDSDGQPMKDGGFLAGISRDSFVMNPWALRALGFVIALAVLDCLLSQVFYCCKSIIRCCRRRPEAEELTDLEQGVQTDNAFFDSTQVCLAAYLEQFRRGNQQQRMITGPNAPTREDDRWAEDIFLDVV